MSDYKVLFTKDEIGQRVKILGELISSDFEGETLDVVCLVDTGHVFMADLIRAISVPVRTHFVSMAVREVVDPNYDRQRQEIFFYPEIEGEGRTMLVVDGVLQTGVTLDFLLRRLWAREPKDVKMAVLLDKGSERRVLLEPDYVGFELASNDIVVGYGLAWQGLDGNLPYLGSLEKKKPAKEEKTAAGKGAGGRGKGSKKKAKK